MCGTWKRGWPGYIYMNNKRMNYTSVQFDIQLPECVDLSYDSEGKAKLSFNSQRSENGSHIVGINKIDESKYRVVAYSPQNS